MTGKHLRPHVRNQNPLGSDPRRFCDRARDHVGGDPMDRLAARLSAATRASLGCGCETADLSAARLLLVVVPLRRLCAADLFRGRGDRSLGGIHRDHRRDRHVGLAGAGSQARHDLWLRALGDAKGGSRVPDFSVPMASCLADSATTIFATTVRSMCCALRRPGPGRASASSSRRS